MVTGSTGANERANLVADVNILSEIVAYLFTRQLAQGSAANEIKRLPESIMERMDQQLSPRKDQSQKIFDDGMALYPERLQRLLASMNAYRT